MFLYLYSADAAVEDPVEPKRWDYGMTQGQRQEYIDDIKNCIYRQVGKRVINQDTFDLLFIISCVTTDKFKNQLSEKEFCSVYEYKDFLTLFLKYNALMVFTFLFNPTPISLVVCQLLPILYAGFGIPFVYFSPSSRNKF